MIGDKTVLEFIFQFLIIVQPFIWIWLYESTYNVPENVKLLVYVLLLDIGLVVYSNQIQIGYYTTSILLQYTALTAGSFYLYNIRKPVKEAVSLAFLTVFLNSFYWELPLHLVELFTVGVYLGQIIQYWRLVPGYYLATRFTYTKNQKRTLLLGIIWSWILMIVRAGIPVVSTRAWLMGLNRATCMILLTKTILEAKPNDYSDQETSHSP